MKSSEFLNHKWELGDTLWFVPEIQDEYTEILKVRLVEIKKMRIFNVKFYEFIDFHGHIHSIEDNEGVWDSRCCANFFFDENEAIIRFKEKKEAFKKKLKTKIDKMEEELFDLKESLKVLKTTLKKL